MNARALTIAAVMLSGSLLAETMGDRILNAAKEPQNWLTYSDGYSSQRYSELTDMIQQNVAGTRLPSAPVPGSFMLLAGRTAPRFQPKPRQFGKKGNATAGSARIPRLQRAAARRLVAVSRVPAVETLRLSANLARSYGALIAIDSESGDKKWEFKMADYTESGVLTTASDLVFVGGREGKFVALDDRDGKLLWHTTLSGTVASRPNLCRRWTLVCRGVRRKLALCIRSTRSTKSVIVAPIKLT